MKTLFRKLAGVLMVAIAIVLVGCVGPKIDWNARIGSYTFDEAVREMGPPERQATLSDGSKVVDWVTERAYQSGGIGFGSRFYSSGRYGYYDPFVMTQLEHRFPDRVVRLTFSPDGKLKEAKRGAQ